MARLAAHPIPARSWAVSSVGYRLPMCDACTPLRDVLELLTEPPAVVGVRRLDAEDDLPASLRRRVGPPQGKGSRGVTGHVVEPRPGDALAIVAANE